ncbi:MAG: hypothetical protein COU08_02410 [Candidatus Harrisonbacteria bacterium CG10_big_fil_rev_8_21_14_0_10_42_17]|uniref:Uncharacterized protein n=1 Tax=Candidatus Harrisonbacteria bacterium CG10_big_fil_rev_8_21_14_0_10_42_17 TaxID=1974584 RepID=A0A2M6WHZ7_9BACT|nr:MAG: hypothetical protein COU08_02410 [Candidatus Harrisonbacteria bacterium CG10_big_fil_rev_8_21_14_0_10_42_17]
MRIGLVTPPSLFLSDERTFMHLGVLKVAAALEQHHPVDVIDLSGFQNPDTALLDILREMRPDVVGFTATTPQMPSVAKLLSVVGEEFPHIRTILGGPHATLINASSKIEQRAGIRSRATRALDQLFTLTDVIVAGDGEDAIFDAFEDDPPRLIDADDRTSTLFLSNRRLTKLPLPARHLVNVPSYRYQIDGVPALSMIAQLGCPFECGFCGGRNSPFLRKIRLRPTEHILHEMRHIYETYGIRGIMFYDDELNVNPKFADLLEGIITLAKELGIEWRLRGFLKAELLSRHKDADRIASLMYEAGFREVLCGFESAHPLILESINKKATLDDNTRFVEIVRRNGLRIKALMSIGHPGESLETVHATRDWIREIHPESFDISRITAYPGSPYFDNAVETETGVWTHIAPNGCRFHSPETDFTRDYLFYKGDRGVRDGLKTIFAWTDDLTARDLGHLAHEIEAELRQDLGQPFQTDAPTVLYDHSMGQGFPDTILRSTNPKV